MKGLKILFILLLFTQSIACVKQKSIDELIEIAVQEKIDKLKKQKIEDCWIYIGKQAEIHVDSIMYLEIGSAVNNSIFVPDRPIREDDSLLYEINLDSSGIDEYWLDTLIKK